MRLVWVLNLCLKHSNTSLGGLRDDVYLNWSKLDFAVAGAIFVLAESGFAMVEIWASEALLVPQLCVYLASGTLVHRCTSRSAFISNVLQAQTGKDGPV